MSANDAITKCTRCGKLIAVSEAGKWQDAPVCPECWKQLSDARAASKVASDTSMRMLEGDAEAFLKQARSLGMWLTLVGVVLIVCSGISGISLLERAQGAVETAIVVAALCAGVCVGMLPISVGQLVIAWSELYVRTAFSCEQQTGILASIIAKKKGTAGQSGTGM